MYKAIFMAIISLHEMNENHKKPVDSSDALFNDTLDFLKELRVFLINPMGHVSSIVEDLNKKNKYATTI